MLSYRNTGEHCSCQMLKMAVILELGFQFLSLACRTALLFSGGQPLLIFFFLCFLAQTASPGIEILSAVISTINSHNKVALKLCRAEAIIGGQLQAHTIMEGKLRGSTVCSLVQISVPFHTIRL